MSFFKSFFYRLFKFERCPKQLALASSLGVFVAFSPLVGFHTLMVFLFSWLFALNAFVIFAISCGINNPWTMVPVYGSGYVCGEWLLRWFNVDGMASNPNWVTHLNYYICHYTGLQGLSFWSFMVGGNLLGVVLGCILYPVFKYLFTVLLPEQ